MIRIKKIINIIFPIHTKEIAITLVFLFILMFLQTLGKDSSQVIDSVNRPSYFKGDEELTLYYKEKELGIDKAPITFRVDKLDVLNEEVDKYLEYVSNYIKEELTSQYDNYRRITGPLVMIQRFEECKISYTLSPSDYINMDGWMDYENWDEEKAITVKYDIEFAGHYRSEQTELLIKKEDFTKEYKQVFLEHKLLFEINIRNENNGYSKIDLPKDVVFYNQKKKDGLVYFIMLWVIIFISFSFIAYYEVGLRKSEESVKRKVQLTYFINSFALLYQTGMTIQKSFKTTLNNRLLSIEASDSIYHDFNQVRLMIESDLKFDQVLKLFSEFFTSRECHRFHRLLLQTLKQGDDHLIEQLEYMTRIMWEERIREARKESEKASSKLVFPMLLIFIVILIISIVPTFLEVQSIF